MSSVQTCTEGKRATYELGVSWEWLNGLRTPRSHCKRGDDSTLIASEISDLEHDDFIHP
jgi:hypothetical protein